MNREKEFAKYGRAYEAPWYKMGDDRRKAVQAYVADLEPKGSLLDVGTGRGETLALAEACGFKVVRGTEVVPYLVDGERVVYAEGHALPFADGSFDWVTMFDVMEHLIPGDDEAVVREMCRVAKHGVVVTIANFPSVRSNGDVLHINLRPYKEWDALLRDWSGLDVEWLYNHGSISEGWRLSRAS